MSTTRERKSSIGSILSGTGPEEILEGEKEQSQIELQDNNINLGKILITIAAQHNELCKKLQLAEQKISLEEITRESNNIYNKEQKWTEKLEKNNEIIDNLSHNIQNEILNKEMDFSSFNQAIKIPNNFSPIKTLITPAKQAEAIKIFNIKRPFSGHENIFEFLSKMNSCQEILHLSEDEFINILHSQTTRECHSLLADLIDAKHSIKDIYYTLVSLYDQRITPQAAQNELNRIKCRKFEHIVKLTARIMKLASRVAAQFPAGSSRNEFFNVECLNSLARSLPIASKNLVKNHYNSLVLRLGRSPQFIELLKILRPFFDSINNDINNNSDFNRDNFGKNRFNNFNQNRNFKIRYIRTNDNNFKTNNSGERGNNSNKFTNNNFKNFSSNKRSNITNNSNFTKIGERKGGNRDRRSKYCSLCGRTDHYASEVCYSMKNNEGRVIKVMPTFDNCPKCLEKSGKKLFHPVEFCILRENYPKRNKRKD